ncbi:hypothetical protein A3L11_10500 [Thermococcus siculi]|uniref:DUF4855 domain-containing protein n=1 Tax=Thermococcus siculi TaxID=72803 RepID=A0A2Z2MP62_9EURY|nr:DUF4855 domain-containing protein [Thermococcus siculi]ASJ09638.1 hypothetical protein A3L11_10500 [Thermococcus siculi]
MSTFALFWFEWESNKYISRMKVGTSEATALDFKIRGFDYLVALDGEGERSHYTGDGYSDGKQLARFLEDTIADMEYYVTIPFYFYQFGKKIPRDSVSGNFDGSYWQRWIDGVVDSAGNNLKGFYWSLEAPGQFTYGYGDGIVSRYLIEGISYYVRRDYGLDLIWIPSLGGRTISDLEKYTDIKHYHGYFDYVFCQPNYYQKQFMSDGAPYQYSNLLDVFQWIQSIDYPTVSIELEADRGVLGIRCLDNRDCPTGTSCDGSYCHENCRALNSVSCIDYACDYVNAQYDTLGKLWTNRAYYFSTNLKAIDTVRNRCPKW